jgi:aspartyl-tRNA(Asn)/glutamyl-tRNA(Gln) amidotransferase subunit A
MAYAMSILDQFTELVNTIPVQDSVQPGLAAIAHHEIETPIAVNTQPSEQVAPADSSITQLRAAFAGGSLTAQELVRDLIERIDERDPLVLGWVTIASDVVEQAARCDEQLASNAERKPLLGIPIGVKDLIDVSGMPTLCGSGHGSPGAVDSDAPAIARLRDAGAIIIGKTTTHEYAFGGTTPPTRNPWQLDRVPGGSSGGSGAVLGAGMVPGAIGTDTAGSVRIPASYCGAVGFMGSYGSVPTDSVAVLAWSLDHVGAMARTVPDVAIMHKVIAALPNPGTPLAPGLPATIGIPRQVLEPMHP